MNRKVFKHKLTVRYFETDQMKMVYYSHYLVWFEAARTHLLKDRGLSYTKFEEMGYYLPVSESYCKYISPAQYEDEISVEVWVEELKNATLKMGYRVVREENNKLLATGYTVHPCINKERKVVPFPEEFRKILSKNHTSTDITKKLNSVYSKESDKFDDKLQKMQMRSIKK